MKLFEEVKERGTYSKKLNSVTQHHTEQNLTLTDTKAEPGVLYSPAILSFKSETLAPL